MQIVSNNLPEAISPWSAWQMLFHPEKGDEAVIMTGYLSGGFENTWCDDIISDIVGWLQYPREDVEKPRRLAIYVGSWQDSETYDRAVDMLGRLLASIDEKYRSHVFVAEVPKLHIKAYAMFAGEPGTGSPNCIRLLTGSSNLTYSSMAAGHNIEMDTWFEGAADSSVLRSYGIGLRNAQLACLTEKSHDQALTETSRLAQHRPLVARRVYSDAYDQQKFYDDIEDAMTTYEQEMLERRETTKSKTLNAEMQKASDDCMRSDGNS